MRPLVLLGVIACGSGNPPATLVATHTTSTLALGCEVAVVDADGGLFVFDRDGVVISRSGAVIARARAPLASGEPGRWTSAAAITMPGGARWAVGVAGDALWRVTSGGELEPMSARLGVGDARVLSIDGAGTTFAIGLVGGLAVSRDGVHLMRFATGDARLVAVARERIAVALADAVTVYDLAANTQVRYRVDAATKVAFLTPGHGAPLLVVAARGAVYVERAGKLHRITAPADLRQVAVSGSWIWMLARDALFLRKDQQLLRTASPVTRSTRLYPAPRGDAWLAQPTQLSRHSMNELGDASWRATVEPLFARVCQSCHLPDGEAGLDLGSFERWREHAPLIEEALQSGAMPPPDTELTVSERRALLRWLAAAR